MALFHKNLTSNTHNSMIKSTTADHGFNEIYSILQQTNLWTNRLETARVDLAGANTGYTYPGFPGGESLGIGIVAD